MTPAIKRIVSQQAEDAGLWFIARTAPEAYLQQALRTLHTVIERTYGGKNMDEKIRAVLMEVAGYLTLVAKGMPVNPKEADELLDKIGDLLEPA